MSDFLLIARITSSSGLSGFVKLKIITDYPQQLFDLREVYIDFFGTKKKFIVEEVRESSKYFIIKFEKFDTERELEVLIGREIYVSEKDSPDLPDGAFYVHELIDASVWRGSVFLGKVKDVLKLPANDVLVIESKDSKELLLPFVLDFIDHFDEENKKLVFKPGAGIYEDDEN